MTTHTICYHSADIDGFCSGAIAKLHLLKCGIKSDEIRLIGWNYGDPVPSIPDSQQVIMTDISFPPESMADIKRRCHLTWIDHHVTAIKDGDIMGYNSGPGFRKVGDSASMLAWIFFFGPHVPDAVYWVDRYDVWKKEDPKSPELTWEMVMEVQYGLRFHMSPPNTDKGFEQWAILLADSDRMDEVIADGSLIYQAEKKSNEIRCSKAFDLIFEGVKFAAINNTLAGSAVLDSYARSDHDALMVFSFHGRRQEWDVSMYKNEKSDQDIDLSLIAKRYGGGGHASSCGFRTGDVIDVLSWKDAEDDRISAEKQAAAFNKENEGYDLEHEK